MSGQEEEATLFESKPALQRLTGVVEQWAAQEGRLTPICMSLAWRNVFVSYCVSVCVCASVSALACVRTFA